MQIMQCKFAQSAYSDRDGAREREGKREREGGGWREGEKRDKIKREGERKRVRKGERGIRVEK
jgi:hypothetical protein